jgi:hypothetical protein
MNRTNPVSNTIRRANAERLNSEIAAVRKAWRLTPPESNYRDPQWLKSAASVAAKAGLLPKCRRGDLVIDQLRRAGYDRAIDHFAVLRVGGERHVILEPYECTCSMDTARRIAAELADRLACNAWASLYS